MSLPILILASASPRRSELLEGLGIEFECRPVEIDESARGSEAPAEYVARLAVEKASAASAADGELVLAADTIVEFDGDLLGKPRDSYHAVETLKRLSGREHRVLTGVCLLEAGGGRVVSEVEETRVRMKRFTERELEWYVASGEPDDKAGAYALQGLGALFVEGLAGNNTNVIGLPLPVVYRLFERLGCDLLERCRIG